MLDNIKVIRDMEKESLHSRMALYLKEDSKKINLFMALTLGLMVEYITVNGTIYIVTEKAHIG
jgi:hypothetical protein